ncbi:MAG: hypothetical protein QOG61_1125 [Candidatus Binataceae bacterium]|nr:hypothetical protein [Candidatus Binataceae bacterium]
MTTQNYAPLDEALEMLRPYGPELQNGNSNHAPMAAEAMCVLGRGDAVIEWVDRYRHDLQPARTSHSIIRESEWRDVLGESDRVADWQAFFANELAEHPSPEVLDCWVARLAPGIIAAAAHGAIRTAHAARSLAASQNEAHLRELAAGLAYWAAKYQTLPGTLDSNSESATPAGESEFTQRPSRSPTASHLARRSMISPNMRPARAIEALELLPVARRGVLKSLTGALPELDTFDPFRGVISMIEVPHDPAAVLSELTNGFAEVLLANATTPLLTIAFVHCLTALYAVRNLTPHLSNETTRSAVKYGWQAAAALYTVLGTKAHSIAENITPAIERDDLIDRAIRSGDEHAIKYTEACLSEYVMSPSPIYLRAADRAIDLLTPTANSVRG